MKPVLVLAAIVSLASPVQADESPPSVPEAAPGAEPPPRTKLDTSKLEALFTKATNDYDTGKWDDAITGFRELYGLMPDPSFLFNIGQAYRQKGACRDATAAYKSYLRNASDANRPRVEQYVKELEPCVKVEEENARRLLPPPRLSTRDRRLRIVGLATIGAGAITLGIAAAFTVKANSLEGDFESCVVTRMCELAVANDLDRRGRKANRNATIAAITGGSVLAIGVGIALFTVFRSERVTVTPAANGAVVGMVGAF